MTLSYRSDTLIIVLGWRRSLRKVLGEVPRVSSVITSSDLVNDRRGRRLDWQMCFSQNISAKTSTAQAFWYLFRSFTTRITALNHLSQFFKLRVLIEFYPSLTWNFNRLKK